MKKPCFWLNLTCALGPGLPFPCAKTWENLSRLAATFFFAKLDRTWGLPWEPCHGTVHWPSLVVLGYPIVGCTALIRSRREKSHMCSTVFEQGMVDPNLWFQTVLSRCAWDVAFLLWESCIFHMSSICFCFSLRAIFVCTHIYNLHEHPQKFIDWASLLILTHMDIRLACRLPASGLSKSQMHLSTQELTCTEELCLYLSKLGSKPCDNLVTQLIAIRDLMLWPTFMTMFTVL